MLPLVEANFQPIKSTTQILVVMCFEYGILVTCLSQTTFHREISGGVTKSQLFSHATILRW